MTPARLPTLARAAAFPRALLRAALLTLWISLCAFMISLTWGYARVARRRMAGAPLRGRIIMQCYRGILRIIGLHVRQRGELTCDRPLVVMANHISYLDIVVLGSRLPVRFTPKADIARWPAIGTICRLCGDIFVDRRPEKIREARAAIHQALGQGEAVCLFPEGTTGNGLHLLPFKSGIFSLAGEEIEGRVTVVQPVAVAYTKLWRLPIDKAQWPMLAWYGDMQLLPHLWNVLTLGRIDAELVVLPAYLPGAGVGRRELATACHREIGNSLLEVRQREKPAIVPRPPLNYSLSRLFSRCRKR